MVQAWTEAEKLGLLFQIIAKAGTIPWDDLELPEGRTRKACIVMIDKEKQKVKKAREGGNEDGTEEGEGKAKAGAKRKASDDGASTPKKAKTPRKKTVKAGADEEAAAEDVEESIEKKDIVKDEPEEGDEF